MPTMIATLVLVAGAAMHAPHAAISARTRLVGALCRSRVLAAGSAPLPSADQVELVQSTWKTVQGIGMEPAGVLLFNKLFDAHPELVQRFPAFGDLPDYRASAAYKSHCSSVMAMIEKTIGLLSTDLDQLTASLDALGRRHAKFYGTQAGDYDAVAVALIGTLGAALGEKFTPEAQEAYTVVYGVVAATMKGDYYD